MDWMRTGCINKSKVLSSGSGRRLDSVLFAMMKKLFPFFIFCAFGSAFAQLSEADTARFSIRAATTGSLSLGNVERFLVISNVDFSHLTKRIGLKTSNTYIYGTFRRTLTEDDFISKNFFYLVPQNRFYPYLMLWLEKNYRRRFDLRYQMGAGITYQLLRQKKNSIKLSLNLTTEETRFFNNQFREFENGDSRVIATWRVAGRLYGHHRLLKNKLHFTYEFWYQPSLEYEDNFRYHGDFLLEIALNKILSFRTAFNYTHENIVLTGVQRDDTFFTFGLSFWKQFP